MFSNIKAVIYGDTQEFQFFMMRCSRESSELNIIGHAAKYENIVKIAELLTPDVIIAEIKEPVESGISIINKLRNNNFKIPIVAVVSAGTSPAVLKIGGITTSVKKPVNINSDNEKEFFDEIAAAAKSAHLKTKDLTAFDYAAESEIKGGAASNKLIAIGASTGGTDAIVRLVKELPGDTPGIVITQHMPVGFTKLFANRLNSVCKMKAKEACDGDIVRTGVIYIAPGGLQMEVDKVNGQYILSCKKGEKYNYHCPSVDVLFYSVAKAAGRRAVGVILTGMGDDGARGLLEMRNSGARTIGQNKETCVVYGMPEVAFRIGSVEKQLPLDEIGNAILQMI